MTKRVEIGSTAWTKVSEGKTRGIIENTTGQNLKIRVEAVGTVPPDAERWGHNLAVNKYWAWEKSSSGADVFVRTQEGSGLLTLTEG